MNVFGPLLMGRITGVIEVLYD